MVLFKLQSFFLLSVVLTSFFRVNFVSSQGISNATVVQESDDAEARYGGRPPRPPSDYPPYEGNDRPPPSRGRCEYDSRDSNCIQSDYCNRNCDVADHSFNRPSMCCHCGGLGEYNCRDMCRLKYRGDRGDWTGECVNCYCHCYNRREF